MTDLGELLTRLTGVELSRGALRSSLDRYVAQRMQELGLRGTHEYYATVLRGDSREQHRLFDVIGVPHTWFFRDAELLGIAETVIRRALDERRPVSVWIPGCATGEDAYSLSMLVQDVGQHVVITASDISVRSLELARAACYGEHSLRELAAPYTEYLRRTQDGWTVSEKVRSLVCFEHHNLMEAPLTHPGGWDLILCRNVLIYFSAQTALACVDRLSSSLRPGGTLLLGPGEHLRAQPSGLRQVVMGQRVAFERGEPRADTPSETPPRGAVRDPGTTRWPAFSVESRPWRSAISSVARSKDPRPIQESSERPGALPSPTRAGTSPPVPAVHRARLLSQPDIGAAIDELLEAAARDPLDAELRMLAGIALYSASEYGSSLTHLRAALLLDDRLWPAALYQGLCLDSMGAPHRARTEYRHAARLVEAGIAAQLALPQALEGLTSELLAMVRLKASPL